MEQCKAVFYHTSPHSHRASTIQKIYLSNGKTLKNFLKRKNNKVRRNYQNVEQSVLFPFNPIPILYNWSDLVVTTVTK